MRLAANTSACRIAVVASTSTMMAFSIRSGSSSSRQRKAWPPCARVEVQVRRIGGRYELGRDPRRGADKLASSRTARYSSIARPAAAGGSPFSPSMPFCRLASALIMLSHQPRIFHHRPAAPQCSGARRSQHPTEEIALPEAAMPVLGKKLSGPVPPIQTVAGPPVGQIEVDFIAQAPLRSYAEAIAD